ncbi:hypothetical protein LA080_016432 [Diaporthe eres]|nr:hypothetical protein LA080_016432 [Diaporthe eres]
MAVASAPTRNARFAESGSGAGFANAVEPRQTDRSDEPVPEASRRICVLQAVAQAHWQTGYVIEIGEKFSLQVQVTDGCTGGWARAVQRSGFFLGQIPGCQWEGSRSSVSHRTAEPACWETPRTEGSPDRPDGKPPVAGLL